MLGLLRGPTDRVPRQSAVLATASLSRGLKRHVGLNYVSPLSTSFLTDTGKLIPEVSTCSVAAMDRRGPWSETDTRRWGHVMSQTLEHEVWGILWERPPLTFEVNDPACWEPIPAHERNTSAIRSERETRENPWEMGIPKGFLRSRSRI